ncbi:hypothetical protein [Micromonospora sediminicola]|uniref:hypothetical protein n=1 Tax=Micromonospora sediminicola TaxID=946078 RepID=UPI00379BEE78
MIARLKRYLAERREAAEVPAGWDTPQARAELAEIVREVTGERPQIRPRTNPEAVYTPRHGSEGETTPSPTYQARHGGDATQVPRDFLLPADYFAAERWRPLPRSMK